MNESDLERGLEMTPTFDVNYTLEDSSTDASSLGTTPGLAVDGWRTEDDFQFNVWVFILLVLVSLPPALSVVYFIIRSNPLSVLICLIILVLHHQVNIYLQFFILLVPVRAQVELLVSLPLALSVVYFTGKHLSPSSWFS